MHVRPAQGRHRQQCALPTQLQLPAAVPLLVWPHTPRLKPGACTCAGLSWQSLASERAHLASHCTLSSTQRPGLLCAGRATPTSSGCERCAGASLCPRATPPRRGPPRPTARSARGRWAAACSAGPACPGPPRLPGWPDPPRHAGRARRVRAAVQRPRAGRRSPAPHAGRALQEGLGCG